MEVSVHRCCLSRTLLYSVIFSSLLAWILSFSRSQHDGRTVTLMLAKLGEGPLLLDRGQGRNRSSVTMDGAEIDCEQEEESCSGRRTINLSSLEATDSVTQNLCWGYEKDCDEKNRLFIPHCLEPYKPWYIICMYVCMYACMHAHTAAMMPVSNLNRRPTVKLHITCIPSKCIPFHDCIMQSRLTFSYVLQLFAVIVFESRLTFI